jgi:hypothetical protein
MHYKINIIKAEVMISIYTNIEHARKVDEELNACRELLRKTNEEAAALKKQYEGIH